jgi:hypothetical protein
VTGPPRDWDKELAQIDKIMTKAPAQPPVASGGPAPAARSGGPPPMAPASGKAAFSTWLRVLLAVVLAGAMTQWPYGNRCGIPLFLYLGSAGVVALAGLWSGVTSWRRRLGLAHTISLLVMLWGLILGAAVVLPRTGYAKTALTWFCP